MALKLKKTIKLDSAGCGQSSLKLNTISPGQVSAYVTYKAKKATAKLLVTK
jgi:ribosomal protein L33